jgi:hypothetical protein
MGLEECCNCFEPTLPMATEWTMENQPGHLDLGGPDRAESDDVSQDLPSRWEFGRQDLKSHRT